MNCKNQKHGDDWTIYNGDCVEVMKALPDNSIHMGIHSPPFSNLYIYSDSDRDMGNSEDDAEFMRHYRFAIDEMLRITIPGRVVVVHCKDLPRYANKHGTTGLIDFPGMCIQEFEESGWVFHSRVTIWKCPVVERERTNNNGLLHKTVKRDTSQVRQGMADYLLVFRKPPSEGLMSDEPVERVKGFDRYIGLRGSSNKDHPSPYSRKSTAGDPSIDIWRRYAEPVWWDVNQTDVLNFKLGTSEKDEKHICVERGTLILTKERGLVEIQNVEPGEHTVTHKGRWRKILAKAKTAEQAEVVLLKAQGVRLRLTPDHKVWCKRATDGGKRKDKAKASTAEWVRSDNSSGHFVSLQLPEPSGEPSELTAQEWWIVGRWIADGHRESRNGGLMISVGKEKLEQFLSIVGSYAGASNIRQAVQVRVKDPKRKLRNIIDHCGKGADRKRLPPQAFDLSRSDAKSLLDGYLSGDGHYQPDRDRYSLSTVSRELAVGMQFLIHRAYGSIATIAPGRPAGLTTIEGRTVNTKQDWIVTFNVSGYTFGFSENGVDWKPVKSVEPDGTAETWTLEVEEDNSYTAEGMVVKNCPLQLDLISRAVDIWSNPGDVVFSPFAGVGSEGVGAMRVGRKFVGIELKEGYFNVACQFLDDHSVLNSQEDLFG